MDTTAAVQDRVVQALDTNESLDIRAGNTKHQLGRRCQGDSALDVSALDKVVSYEPGELILVVQPGMALKAIEELLGAENQHLPFEPPHWGAGATIGGTMACNLSGPRRFKAGALRDFILGLEMVDGHGECVRAGGKVVKNVTGYDLSKVLSGSFGTLGVLTEICLKVWPRPETGQTLVVHGQTPETALQLMLHLATMPYEITGLTYLPAADPKESRTLARLEGPGPSVAAQLHRLSADIEADTSAVEEGDSELFWMRLRELDPFQPAPGEQLWRFAVPPASAMQLLETLKKHALLRWGLDWGGGLLWALFPAPVQAALLHQAARSHQGMAWRFATTADDPNAEAFTPLSDGLKRLNQILKNAFDPVAIFNPGRMYAT